MTDESWFEDTAFIPRDFAEAVWKATAPAPPAKILWDDIVAVYQRMLPQRLQPTDPRGWTPYIDRTDPEQVAAAHAALDAYEEHMARNRTHPLPPPTPRTEPWADTLIHYLRHLELDTAGVPPIGPRLQQRHPIGRIHWTPRAYAGLHGLTAEAADMFVEMATALQRDHD